ncbi:hypothetical protein BD560DRAFT_434473 [Blakeslea trispora]|nr:hypothetical protein BD560DRAFT_434473 [Blakeslea trispora]
MSFPYHIFNQESSTKDKRPKKSILDRPLSRALPQGNYYIDYTNFEINIPNYTFGKAIELAGAGGLIAVSIGKRNKDNKVILAKLSPHSVRLEREYYVTKRLYSITSGEKYVPNAIEYVSLVQDGLAALLYTDIEPNDYIYFEQDLAPNYFSLYNLAQLTAMTHLWQDRKPEADCNDITFELFLRFAIECCSTLQFLHENGVVHGELRPSAFLLRHTNHELTSKIWNFGGGLNSYEELLLTTSKWRSYMSHNNHNEDLERNFDLNTSNPSRFYSPKEFKSSLVYVSPEQTGRTSNALDHRADLYSLGIMFFIVLTDTPPFQGTAMHVIHSILSKNVPLVHTIRKDIPPVISLIIDKLTRKAVDERYDSAYGLREDLYECQRRLNTAESDEALVYFPLGLNDINPVFKVSDAMYGRDKEAELIRSIVENTFHFHQQAKKKAQAVTQTNPKEEDNSALKEADNLRANSSTSLDHTVCEVIVLKGPGGIGKSTLVSSLNVQARQFGYTACAKFDKNQKRPYNGLLKCLSSILRQLLTESEHVVREFYKDLKKTLGPQFSNVRLMVNMVPELKPILSDNQDNDVNTNLNEDALSNILNTETRFHSVYLNIVRVIAKKKLLTLCLDDLQEADESSIRLINAFISSRATALVILTFRDGSETPKRVVDILEKCSNPVTNIQLYPLSIDDVRDLVLNTFYNINTNILDQQREAIVAKERIDTIMPLVSIIYNWTRGNPFYAKQFLKHMKRKDDIWFDWNEKHWKFRLDNIKGFFDVQQQQHHHSPPRINNRSSHDTFHSAIDPMKQQSAHPDQHTFDVRNLVSHLHSLDTGAQCFLMWASLLGHVFNFRRIKWLMLASDDDKSTSSLRLSDEEDDISMINELQEDQAMLGLQIALNEGVIQYKSGNEFCFIHDRYYQAASMLIVSSTQRETMHLKIGQMLMLEEEEGGGEDDNVFMMADHFLKSARLIAMMNKRKPYREVLIRAGNEATLSGALQMSAGYYECALSLLDQDVDKRWQDDADSSFVETLNLYMKILELKLLNNKDFHTITGVSSSHITTTTATQKEGQIIDNRKVVDRTTSVVADGNKLVTATTFIMQDEMRDDMVHQIMQRTKDKPYERSQAWRIQARICFQQSQYRKGIHNILEGLEELGIVVDTNITEQEVLTYYWQIKQKIIHSGFSVLMESGLCQSSKQIAVMTLLNEACTGAYWVNPILVDFFALKLCELSLEYGYTPASGGGFIWAGCTATRVSEFKFAAELGKFGVALCEKYAGNSEIARAIIVYHSLLAQWTGVHVREYIYQYQRAYKYAIAGGDQLYSSMALFHVATTLYWTSSNLFDLHWHLNHSLEECSKGSSKDVLILNISLWRSVMVFQGKTDITQDPEKMMNDPDSSFDEPSFVEDLKSQSVNSGNPLNWHYSFKMILLFHFGFTKAASELGFKIFDNSINEIVHRHIGIAMYYHSIAIVESLRDPELDSVTREKYTKQLYKNESKLNDLATYSEVNYRMYHKIVQAQISTLDLNNLSHSLQLYNEVMELALKGKWHSFLGLTFELASEHYMRCGLSQLAVPTLSRSIEFYARWGAIGKVQYLEKKYSKELQGQVVSGKEDRSVQTEDVIVGTTTVAEKNATVWDNNSSDGNTHDSSLKESFNEDNSPSGGENRPSESSTRITTGQEGFNRLREDALFSLDMIDLTSIIKSSQVISNEMNSFDELLKKMMGIIMVNSGAESGAIIIKEGYFGIAAYSVRSSDTCQTYEPLLALCDDDDKILASIVHYVIHTTTSLFIPNVQADPRFTTGEKRAAVICMPIMHKNSLVGVLYLQANLNAFTHKHNNVLSILCDQIGISITNALLFKSVQQATKANALMIESQVKALEEARASKEQALRATKMKSNFLANMSHELRTPFSGFYGMISLLSETRLDPEQREFVTIAKQSCEMLLHIIDDLLDFSKLEAHKVKLLHGLFHIEDLIADRLELLITLATNKNVELSYFIDANVPSMVFGDGNRIGQILMNLIGNAIKFTHHGEVVVHCGLDTSAELIEPDNIILKISVRDTGIGMSEEEIKGLFLPFSQVDGSTTRNFGGTGLGLSICLQLVKLMHGVISVDSVVNEGSTFSFTIQVKGGDAVSEVDASYDSRCNTINEFREQLGQPRLLVLSSDRAHMMIRGFIPWMSSIDHTCDPDEAIQMAKKVTYDCIVIDSPNLDVLGSFIESAEETCNLGKTRILLLLAPAVDNIRRHFAASRENKMDQTHRASQLQTNRFHHYLFHPLVTRISKPIRTIKLLNALVNMLTTPDDPSDPTPSPADSTHLISNSNSMHADTFASTTTTASSLSHETTANHEVTDHHAVTDASQESASSSPPLLVTPPYSRMNHDAFSPEELALFKGRKILVAEDNFIAQRLIVKQLSRLGFVVEKCNNGFECYDTWKSRGPGYFLLAWIDHHMPGCDGLEATRKIRRHEKDMNYSPALPIIALTADIQLTAQQSCLEAGMNDYVTKPLMQKDLATILRKYCLGPTVLQ